MSDFPGYVGPCIIEQHGTYFDLLDAQKQFVCRKTDREKLEFIKRAIDVCLSPAPQPKTIERSSGECQEAVSPNQRAASVGQASLP